jgi:hypothetical protein
VKLTTFRGIFLMIALLLSVSVVQAQQVNWAFPKPDQAEKTIGAKQFYDLGDGFSARFEPFKEGQAEIIVLPDNVDQWIANAKRQKRGNIPGKEEFLTAIALDKAIIPPKGDACRYQGTGRLDGRNFHLYEFRNGTVIGAALSDTGTFVLLVQLGKPGETMPAAPVPNSAPEKKCYENGRKVPCPKS